MNLKFKIQIQNLNSKFLFKISFHSNLKFKIQI